MHKDLISGKRQYQFVEKYYFPRAAGSEEEKKTAEGIFSELLELGMHTPYDQITLISPQALRNSTIGWLFHGKIKFLRVDRIQERSFKNDITGKSTETS